MTRPIFIVAEPEPEQALSARKLVLETAKFNVITAHSEQEMFDAVEQFPKVTAVIIHSNLKGHEPVRMIKGVKSKLPRTPVILLSPNGGNLKGADFAVNSHDPQELVQLLRHRFGDPTRLEDGPPESSASEPDSPPRRRIT